MELNANLRDAKMNDPKLLEETIFAGVLACPAEERASYLEAECGGDAGLRERIQILIDAHEEPEFMQSGR